MVTQPASSVAPLAARYGQAGFSERYGCLSSAATFGRIPTVRRRGPWIAGLVAAVLAGIAIGMLANRSTPTRTTSPLLM